MRGCFRHRVGRTRRLTGLLQGVNSLSPGDPEQSGRQMQCAILCDASHEADLVKHRLRSGLCSEAHAESTTNLVLPFRPEEPCLDEES